MIFLKKIQKYLFYVFTAGCIFSLGILVGRESSPVTFDTQKFQKRLEVIVKEFEKRKGVQEKIHLKFYKALAKPIPEESGTSKEKLLEIIPKKETITDMDTIPIKTSRKKQTLKKQTLKKVKINSMIKKKE